MITNYFSYCSPLLRLLVIGFILSSAIPGRAADITTLIADARSHLESNKAIEGLAFAKEAVRGDPADYRGHYYVALAYLAMEKFDEAAAAAQESLAHTTADTKAGVERLIATISEARDEQGQTSTLIKAGDEAFESGLAAKAADLYRKAFLATPTRSDVGLKAAMIYAERLDQLMDAAMLWNKIAMSNDEANAVQAKDKLAQHSNALEKLYKEKSATPTLPNLLGLLEIFPQRPDLHLSVSALYAMDRNVQNTIRHLAEAVKNGATISQVSGMNEFRLLLANDPSSAFETFLNDAFGPNLALRMHEQTSQELSQANRQRAIRVQEEQNRALRSIRQRQDEARATEARKRMEAQQEQERAAQAKRKMEEERAAQAKRQMEEDFIRKARALEN